PARARSPHRRPRPPARGPRLAPRQLAASRSWYVLLRPGSVAEPAACWPVRTAPPPAHRASTLSIGRRGPHFRLVPHGALASARSASTAPPGTARRRGDVGPAASRAVADRRYSSAIAA